MNLYGMLVQRRSAGGSLWARLILTLGAVLAPFSVALPLGTLYLLPAIIEPLEEVIAEVVEELEPLRHLQITLLTASVAAYGVGEAKNEDEEFADSIRAVEEAFERVSAAPFKDPEELALIEAARREWQQARHFKSAGRRAAFHAETASELLDGIYVPARREIEQSRAKAQVAKTNSVIVTVIAFLVALAISVYAAARLVKPLLRDVLALRQGASRLAQGDLSHRVEAPLTDELSELASAFNAMALRIEKSQAELAELATRDGLTGLLNRREFLRLLRDELARSRRYAHACTLLMLDIDRFKSVNDTWGHPAGDAVIRAVAELLFNELRPTDRAARYGGEEFAILLPETDARGGLVAGERIRAAVAAASIAISSDRAIQVSVSIGVAAYSSAGADEQTLVSCADRALYSAKQSGRNKVVVFDVTGSSADLP